MLHQYIIFVFSILSMKIAASSLPSGRFSCHPDEKLALLRLKVVILPGNSTSLYCSGDFNMKPTTKLVSWNADRDCCSWDGVTCDQSIGRVTHLDLGCKPRNPSAAFSAQLPSKNGTASDAELFSSATHSGNSPLQNLTELQVLIFDGLNMSGVDPTFLMFLPSSLEVLSLQSCQLQWTVPENIFSLSAIQFLDLSQNEEFVGNLPVLNWSNPNLETLDLSFTGLSGELPDSIGNLKSLNRLRLRNCNFSGPIPDSIGDLSQLLLLDLSFNQFSGHIPPALSGLHQLNNLALSSNAFVGPIPDIFINKSQLAYLDFSYNQFTAPVPPSLTSLPNLISLDLSNNLIGGPILSSFLSLPSLKWLDLSNNQLSGPIDEFNGTSLRGINLSGNQLQGPLPASMFELANLTELQISSNGLTGIKDLESLSKLQNLATLDLSHNMLSLSDISNHELSMPNLQWLSLSWCNLTEFPAFIRTSKNLNWLDLSGNIIGGKVPDWMWEVGKDSLGYLNLSHNSLESFDQIPWQNLMYLDLSSNLIQGPIPPAPTSQIMTGLDISNNRITGSIPSSICELRFLQILHLSKNNLSGVIPQCLGNFSLSLLVLDLKENQLSGNINFTFEENNSLKSLHLNGNQLQGALPPSLINCHQLEVLDLGNNDFSDTFPDWLEILPNLKILVLRSNRLHGVTTHSKADTPFQQLRILDLSNNEFTGLLPTKYFQNMKAMMLKEKDHSQLHYMGQGYYQDSITLTMKGRGISIEKILTILTTVDLSSNKFNGIIPEVIGELGSLKGLNLSHNSLTYRIPSSMGNLLELEWLDLSSNKLIGKIPPDLIDLTSLEQLNLSYNQLVGPIPKGNQFNTFQADSYSGNSGLCGYPLSQECSGKHTSPPGFPWNTPHRDISEDSNEFERKVILVGYGCGIPFGFVLGAVKIKNRLVVKLMQHFSPVTSMSMPGWSRWTWTEIFP